RIELKVFMRWCPPVFVQRRIARSERSSLLTLEQSKRSAKPGRIHKNYLYCLDCLTWREPAADCGVLRALVSLAFNVNLSRYCSFYPVNSQLRFTWSRP